MKIEAIFEFPLVALQSLVDPCRYAVVLQYLAYGIFL